MAQRISAPAKIAEPAAPAAADPPAGARRRGAAAYVDLWERHVAFVAAHGAPEPAAPPSPEAGPRRE